MSRYVPAIDKTPDELEAYNRSARERNKRYYWRRKHGIIVRAPTQVKCNHGGCQEIIVICGFCREGLCEHD